jgi:ribulose-phosphate 3-epimerase
MIKISPSILSADFAKLGAECARACDGGADLLHVDVMDGCFVPNLTIGAPVIHCLKPYSRVPLDVHLMIDRPERYLDDYIRAGADIVTVHIEATQKTDEILARLSAAGVRPSLSINPDTPAQALFPYLDRLAMVLVMTVQPGFGGQALIERALDKVAQIRAYCRQKGLCTDIEVDGGITPQNVGRAAQAGANVFVAGSAVFQAANLEKAIGELRAEAQKGAADALNG